MCVLISVRRDSVWVVGMGAERGCVREAECHVKTWDSRDVFVFLEAVWVEASYLVEVLTI